jgi:ABC-type proline/glycine betaine transport system permease subunit
LIRALMLRPELLLLDEPLAALDPMVRATLQTELKAVFQHLCQTVILVTHELAEAAWLGDQIVLLRQGAVVQSGTFAWLSETILGVTGLIQTVPSLALLALLVSIPFLGISPLTAIIALFLYGLLPIARNTAAGIQDIPQPVRESAEAMGLEPRARLRAVFLPLASRSILAGIKTSAVINVGTATLAALIGT